MFSEWLKSELDKRGWTQGFLSQRSGLTQGYISQVINGDKEPTWNFCEKLATAFDYSPVDIFKIAGLLPDNSTTQKQKIFDIYERLPQPARIDLERYGDYLLSQSPEPIAN